MDFMRLGDVMQEKGITGKDLAERVGTHPVYISEIVNNKKVPRKELLLKIADVLDVDVRELIVSTKEPDPTDPMEALKAIKRIVDRLDL